MVDNDKIDESALPSAVYNINDQITRLIILSNKHYTQVIACFKFTSCVNFVVRLNPDDFLAGIFKRLKFLLIH